MDLEFCVKRRTFIAISNRYSMSPANAAAILSWMQDWMGTLLRCCVVEGAKMSMSRWSRSHQKGADAVLDGEFE